MDIAVVVSDSREWRSLAPAREAELTRRLAERQAAVGHDVTVYCTQFWDGYEATLRRDGVTYRAVTVAPAKASFTARLPALLALDQPDVVHAVPTPPSAVLAAGQGARLAGVPLVVGWEGHERPRGRLRGRAARAADAVVVPSGLVGTRARKAGTPERRVHDVPQAIDFERVEAVDPAGAYDVVAATPFDEHANLDGLLLALAELRRRDWSALLVGGGGLDDRRVTTGRGDAATPAEGSHAGAGDGEPTASDGGATTDGAGGAATASDGSPAEPPGGAGGDGESGAVDSRAAVERQLADLSIADRVTVVDGLSREERLAHYRGAHVFVQTRARESFARELLWALACGCVGVVEYQADSSAHELLVDHPRGARVTTPEEIETAIEDAGGTERWSVDPEMRRYDWSAVAEEYVDLYRELRRS
jgi:glycosyltransferase involved in cell wall biosynthesis